MNPVTTDAHMQYKGYNGVAEFDAEDQMYYGRVVGLKGDVIGYEGTDLEELEASFHRAVDGYLEMCAEKGKGSRSLLSATGWALLQKVRPSIAPTDWRAISTACAARAVSVRWWISRPCPWRAASVRSAKGWAVIGESWLSAAGRITCCCSAYRKT